MSVARKTDIVVFFVHFHFAERAVEGHFSPRQSGEGGHRQVGFDTVFKLHDHRLVIYNVVVASENASAVLPFFIGFANGFFRDRTGKVDDVKRPPLAAFFFVNVRLVKRPVEVLTAFFYVQAFRAVCAFILILAVRATVRRPFGLISLMEEGQIPHRIHRLAFCIGVILQQIEIVTALLHDHRGRFFVVAPVAAHKAMRLVPVGDLFQPVDAHDFTDRAAIQKLLDLQERRRIAQNVANDHLALVFFVRFEQLVQLVFQGRNGLLQQDIVAKLQRANTHLDVIAVLRGNYERVRTFCLQELFIG